MAQYADAYLYSTVEHTSTAGPQYTFPRRKMVFYAQKEIHCVKRPAHGKPNTVTPSKAGMRIISSAILPAECYAPINVKPAGGRRGIGRDFDIFQKIAVKFPTPGEKM